MTVERLLRGFPQTIQTTFYLDGVAATAGTVTVTITKADGSALVTDAATTAAGTPTFVYSYVLPAQTNLNDLTATWTGTISGSPATATTEIEIVGGFYVTLAAIRALPNLSDTSKFPNAKLIDARQWFETTFERATGVAWVPRFARDRVDGSGTSTLMLPRWPVRRNPVTGLPAILSVRDYTTSAAYTSYDSAALADLVIDGPHLRRVNGTAFTSGARNLVVEYEHGFDRPPADVVEAAKITIQRKLLEDHNGRLPYLTITDGIAQRFTVPGVKGPFSVDEANEAAAANDHRLPAFG